MEDSNSNSPEVEPSEATNEETAAPPLSSETVSEEELTTLQERSIAALGYIGFLAIVPLYLNKKSLFCQFHGRQGILLAMIFFFSKPLMVIDVLHDVIILLQFVIFLYMGSAALSGQWKKLPWIHGTAEKLGKQLIIQEEEA